MHLRNLSRPVLLFRLFLFFLFLYPFEAVQVLGNDELVITVSPEWTYATAGEEEKEVLEKMGLRIRKDPSLTLEVTGHTDTFGMEKENLSIGFYYGARIARDLVDQGVVSPDRLEILSRGEFEPLQRGGNFQEQAPNRRVVIRLGAPPVTQVVREEPGLRTGKSVLIVEPVSGTVDRAYQKVKAIVEGASQTALLTVNGISTLIAVQDSRIDTEVVLERGENIIEVMAWDSSGDFGKDAVSVVYISPPPEIEIEAPRNGDLYDTTHSLVAEVRGRVLSQTPLKETFLFLNGAPRRIEVDNGGRFSQPIVLIRRSNSIRVEATDIFGKTDISEDIDVPTVNLAPKDIVVYLTWDQPGVDLDLHLLGPGDKHTYYAALDPVESSEAIVGGALDLDDKNGFGPEVFSMSRAVPGRYDIEAHYHHSQFNTPSRAQVTVVLYPAEPARRLTRIFGPRELAPGKEEVWFVTSIDLPEGVFSTP